MERNNWEPNGSYFFSLDTLSSTTCITLGVRISNKGVEVSVWVGTFMTQQDHGQEKRFILYHEATM